MTDSNLQRWLNSLTEDARRRGLSGEALKADVRMAFQAVVDRYSVAFANPHSVEPDYPALPESVCHALDEHMSVLSRQFGGAKIDQGPSLKALLRAIAEAIAIESRKAQAASTFAERIAAALNAYNQPQEQEQKQEVPK